MCDSFFFTVVVLSLSGVGIRVILASQDELGVFSLLCFLEDTV